MEYDLNTIEKQLGNSSYKIESKFLDAFYDPIPKGFIKSIILMFILLTVFNIFALIVLIYHYWYKPKIAKRRIPTTENAIDWYFFAERNLKFDHYNEIVTGYKKAIEIDPDDGNFKLRYYQYLAEYSIKHKIPATGMPFGHHVKQLPSNFYSEFKEILLIFKKNKAGLKFQNEKLFAIASWLAFDKQNYHDCIFFGHYSIEIKEFADSEKDRLQKIELLFILAGAYSSINDNKMAISQIIKGIEMSTAFNFKHTIAMGWEFLGECYYQSKNHEMAEFCFLLTHKYESRRWISSYRLYWIYKNSKNTELAQKYERQYILLQKELGPI